MSTAGRTKENLIRFVDFLSQKGNRNIGQPPYTLKAADLDENFQRLILRPNGIESAGFLSPVTFLPDGQHIETVTIDLIVNGKFQQALILGKLIPTA